MNKRKLLIFAARTLAVFVALLLISFSIQAAVHAIFKNRNVDTSYNLAGLLTEDAMAIQEIRWVDTRKTDIFNPYGRLYARLNKTDALVKENSKELEKIKKENPSLYHQITATLKERDAALSPFNNSYNFYHKYLEYQPSSDLGSLKTSDMNEINSRIKKSEDALDRLKNPGLNNLSSIDDYTVLLITYYKGCVEEAQKLADSKDEAAYKSKVKECDGLYAPIRKSVAQKISDSTTTPEVNKSIEELGRLSSELRRQSSN